MRLAYLIALVSVIGCLSLIDWRYKLAFFYDMGRAIKTISSGLLFFVVWDVAGIVMNIFFIGKSRFLTGIRIGQFPLEELFFLTVLCYSVLIVFRFLETRKRVS